MNYMEDGTLPEPAPMNAFMKSPSAIIGDGDIMILPDMAATIFEGEAELAVVIGKRASHVKAADAIRFVVTGDDELLRNPITGSAGCCARAARGHVAAPPMSVMNWRRLIIR